MSAVFRVLDPGLQTTLQDEGRWGYQRFGVPPSGVLDRPSLRIANALLGNPPGTAALEVRYRGPRLRLAGESARIAIVGSPTGATIRRSGARVDVAPGITARLVDGDELIFQPMAGSTTALLAVEGGFAVDPVLGSCSTFIRGGFGGFAGRPIAADDVLPLALPRCRDGLERALGSAQDLAPPDAIRIVPGPQDDHFGEAAWEVFLTADWTITTAADRMGLRLEGPALTHVNGHDITSDGIVSGAIQVPGNGQPIVLLADRQTSGGYPKIATVITADLPAVGRMAPGETIRFRRVSAEAGADAARALAAQTDRSIGTIRDVPGPAVLDEDALHRENLISGVAAGHDHEPTR